MRSDPFALLGEFLTASEAEALAAQFSSGEHTVRALSVVHPMRRGEAKQLLADAGLGHKDGDRAAEVMRAILGAKTSDRDLVPVWTMPGNEAQVGRLTSQFHHLVDAARQSVVCATYNFEPTSYMWTVLKNASEQPGVAVTVYVDGDRGGAARLKTQLPRATVYRSAELSDGRRVVSHAKFTVIDHQLLLLTSANFSFSAENRNVEFGLLVRDSAVAGSVESAMLSKQGTLYELV